jgi:hypothetical protein
MPPAWWPTETDTEFETLAATCRRKAKAALSQGLAFAWLVALISPVVAQAPNSEKRIYSCVDSKGKRITSDRPIDACIDREQELRNKDGSIKGRLPPTPTPDERAEAEAAERRAALERAAFADAVRRDRNLLARYPDEATHRRARGAALDAARQAMKNSESRLAELAAERKPLMGEAEFYAGKTMPPRLMQQIEANDTSMAAQREAIQNQEAELHRINKNHDLELEHLRKLWNGARPGSLGPVSVAVSPMATR